MVGVEIVEINKGNNMRTECVLRKANKQQINKDNKFKDEVKDFGEKRAGHL